MDQLTKERKETEKKLSNLLKLSWTSNSSSNWIWCVICSSSSTKSKPSGKIGLSLYLSFLTCMRTSIIYCTRWLIFPSFKTARNRSKTVALALGEFSERKAPTSRVKPTAISMESSVGRSRRRTRIWSATTSCARDWLTRWARKVVVEWQTI